MDLGEFLYHDVAAALSVRIVDGLEAIHVDQHHCAGPPWLLIVYAPLPIHRSAEPSTVHEASQLVLMCQPLLAVHNDQTLIDDEQERDQGADDRS